MKYLRFVELDDFIAHVKASGEPAHLEFSNMSSKPDKRFGIYQVTFYAVATAAINEHIATIEFPLLHADSLQLNHDDQVKKEERRAQLQERFGKVKAQLEDKGLTIERGLWTLEKPEFLK